MRITFASAVKGAAVLTVGLVLTGCAVRVRPASVTYTPARVEVVATPLRNIDVDVHVHRTSPTVVVNRPIVVEKKTVVVQQKPVVVEKKTTVVIDKNKGNNGNHYGQDKDKWYKPEDRRDHPSGNAKNDKHDKHDKKDKGVAKND